MPAKNTIRLYSAPDFYHVYNRGSNKQPIFLDDHDKEKFISLLERYLDKTTSPRDKNGKEYMKFDIELAAYCLMDNHFHLLLFQKNDPQALTELLRSISTAYTMYFNKKYRRSGHLFQGVFKASLIENDSYLTHISRYIHMNPRNYSTYRWSSVSYYLGAPRPNWLNPSLVGKMTPEQYREFLKSYEGKKAELKIIEGQLASK